LNQQDLLDAAAWVEDRISGLFASYEDKKFTRPIDERREAWNVDYHDQQVVSMENNFSERRFRHVLDVREYLRQKGEPGFAAPKEAPRNTPKYVKPKNDSAPRTFAPPDDGLDPMLKKILLIGGALAAAVLILLTLGRLL
jgi:hypothetical protein